MGKYIRYLFVGFILSFLLAFSQYSSGQADSTGNAARSSMGELCPLCFMNNCDYCEDGNPRTIDELDQLDDGDTGNGGGGNTNCHSNSCTRGGLIFGQFTSWKVIGTVWFYGNLTLNRSSSCNCKAASGTYHKSVLGLGYIFEITHSSTSYFIYPNRVSGEFYGHVIVKDGALGTTLENTMISQTLSYTFSEDCSGGCS